MRLRIMSDLHWEHHIDQGRSFIAELSPGQQQEVLCLVGDIATTEQLVPGVLALCEKFWRVVMVGGNHEYYRAGREGVHKAVLKLHDCAENFTWLDKTLTEIDGHRILGCTLWFPRTTKALQLEGVWSDFSIPGLKHWVYDENLACQDFLRHSLREGDIVLTHHLPLWHSIDPQFAGRDSNCFYVSDCETLIRERRPMLWCHGHTHCSWDYKFESTRVVCNPFGYPKFDQEGRSLLNPKFNPTLIVEV